MSALTRMTQFYRAEPPSVDEWITATGGGVKFGKKVVFGGPNRIGCDLHCYHNGNYVSADGDADTSGDAFLVAVEKIEKTIGDWRK